MSFPEFCRRYGTIEELDVPMGTKDAVQQILMMQEVPSHAYKLGISQVSREMDDVWGTCLGSSADCRRFESRLRQLFFFKMTVLGE